MSGFSKMKFHVTAAEEATPIVGAVVSIVNRRNRLIGKYVTDESGNTTEITVPTPNRRNTAMEPYETYTARIEADGYTPVVIRGLQAYGGIDSTTPVSMSPMPLTRSAEEEVYDIPQPAVLDSTERQTDPREGQTPRIMTKVFIPETVVVHLGAPTNSSAENVRVKFIDYIKNVASSEIYPTWPENALRANILAQISFVLNRIFTEWYPSRGYSFDITNNTGFDQYFVKDRNIFDSVSVIVDDIFNNYVRKKGALNPYFTEYCNGTTATCKGLSQWGTVTLAEQGYSPLRILQYYYGDDIEITETNDIDGISSSYPGYSLKVGMNDPAVGIIKTQLTRIRKNYPGIPAITNMDNTFDSETEAAVKVFQQVFDLTADGIVGKATWNKLSYIYVAVLKLAELNGEMIPLPSESPVVVIKQGSQGSYVELAQYFLNVISAYYPSVPAPAITGYFGEQTLAAVKAVQKEFGLTQDGIVGKNTWKAMYDAFLGIATSTGLAVMYPGTLLKQGSRGEQVRLMQSYLQTISKSSDYSSIPYIDADGIMGPKTVEAVKKFQSAVGLTADGIIGPSTWEAIMLVRLTLK